MIKWTSPVFLCTLLYSFVCTAQEGLIPQPTSNQYVVNVMDPEKSILSNTEISKKHSTLLNALRATDLDDVLNYDGQFTVFAPSNIAFNKLSKITIDKLLDPKNKKVLKATLSYHIIAGKLSASKILRAMCRGNGKATFTTIQGKKITASIKGTDIILTDPYGNRAKIVLADSNQCNGVIHEIDSVFLPVEI